MLMLIWLAIIGMNFSGIQEELGSVFSKLGNGEAGQVTSQAASPTGSASTAVANPFKTILPSAKQIAAKVAGPQHQAPGRPTSFIVRPPETQQQTMARFYSDMK